MENFNFNIVIIIISVIVYAYSQIRKLSQAGSKKPTVNTSSAQEKYRQLTEDLKRKGQDSKKYLIEKAKLEAKQSREIADIALKKQIATANSEYDIKPKYIDYDDNIESGLAVAEKEIKQRSLRQKAQEKALVGVDNNGDNHFKQYSLKRFNHKNMLARLSNKDSLAETLILGEILNKKYF